MKTVRGLTKRRLYKAERAPARVKGFLHKQAPLGCPDATETEIKGALFVLAEQAGAIPGRGIGYDPLRDTYHLIAKHLDGGISRGVLTGKVKDIVVNGEAVTQVIFAARIMAGGQRLERRRVV